MGIELRLHEKIGWALTTTLICGVLLPATPAPPQNSGKQPASKSRRVTPSPQPVLPKLEGGASDRTLRMPTGSVGTDVRWTWPPKSPKSAHPLPEAKSSDPSIQVQVKDGRCLITANESCDGSVTLSWSKLGVNWTFPVWARPAAGRCPDPCRLALSGQADPLDALTHLLLSLRHPQSKLEVLPGKEGRYRVKISGPELYSFDKQVQLQVDKREQSAQSADQLFLSNRPEKLDQAGIAFQRPWDGKGPVRWLFHHRNIRQQDLVLELRCRNLSDKPITFHEMLSALGPSKDEIFVGHQATKRYIQQTKPTLSGWDVDVPPAEERILERLQVKPGQTVSGLALLTPVRGGPLELTVVCLEPNSAPPTQQLSVLESKESRTARGVYQPHRESEVTLEAGGRYQFFELGGPPYCKDSQTGEISPGNFGMVQTYRLHLKNPTDQDVRVHLSVSARGGPARGTFFIDGQLIDPGNLKAEPTSLNQWNLAPKGEITSILETLPQSGSNYPINFILGSAKIDKRPVNDDIAPPVDRRMIP